MALILAIEPDRRQAARISALGRGALDAELLIADSTERAIAALHGRHPDLILTSLLLSPKDETRLRDFESGGVPVPTLMIPVLAGSSRGSNEGGLLARLQRKQTTSQEGCDPKVFAAQIAEYLSRVREEQDAREFEVEEAREVQRVQKVQEVQEVPPLEVLESFESVAPFEPIEPIALVEPVALIESAALVEPVARVEPIATAERLEARSPVDAGWEEIVIEEHEDGARVDIDEDITIELSSDVDLQAFVDELKATYADLFPVQDIQGIQAVQQIQKVQQAQQVLVNEPIEPIAPVEPLEPFEPRVRVAVAHALPYRAAWPSLEGIAAEDAPEYDEFVADFVAAMDEPENPQSADADSDLWMPLSAAPGLAWPRLESTCAKNPNQDEWGFYDPEKCGLSAVVAKLNQVTR